jgi:hypothetical protein
MHQKNGDDTANFGARFAPKTNLLLNNSLIFEHKAGVKKSDVWSRQLA